MKRQSAIPSERDNRSGTMLASTGNLVAIVEIIEAPETSVISPVPSVVAREHAWFAGIRK